MAISKVVIVSFIISVLLVLQLVQAIPYQSPGKNCTTYIPPASGKIDCGLACTARCCESSRPNLCARACKSCCGHCNCVPPGTSGNYETCACYAALTTRGNKPKCP